MKNWGIEKSYSLFCVLTSIMSHLMTSSVPNLHNTKILNISGTRWDMTKRKTPFFTFKGLSNSPIFQYLNFSFHRHFNCCAFTETKHNCTSWQFKQKHLFCSICIIISRANMSAWCFFSLKKSILVSMAWLEDGEVWLSSGIKVYMFLSNKEIPPIIFFSCTIIML